MPPPLRTRPADYHFHAYDYLGAVPFRKEAQPTRGGLMFYSLVQDLNGLLQEGGPQGNNVPNIALTNVGGAIRPGVANRPNMANLQTKALSFGNATNAANAPTVVITGGIHAREWIAPEFVLPPRRVPHYELQPRSAPDQV